MLSPLDVGLVLGLVDGVGEKGEVRGSMVTVRISWAVWNSARRMRRWPARDLGSVGAGYVC